MNLKDSYKNHFRNVPFVLQTVGLVATFMTYAFGGMFFMIAPGYVIGGWAWLVSPVLMFAWWWGLWPLASWATEKLDPRGILD